MSFTTPRPVSWPVRVGDLPPRLAGDRWQPRNADLSETRSAWVLCGLGGVGKTQIAADFAHRVWDAGEVELLVWISATSRLNIVAGYAQAANAVTGTDHTDADQGARVFRDWLANDGRRWLVVLDDVAAAGDLDGWWPPATANGRTVVTTRRRSDAWNGAGRLLIDVDSFTPDEATAYLRRRFLDDQGRLDEVEALAEDLGHLPLALSQAASYIIDRQLNCSAYRQRFADRRRSLKDLVPEAGALPDGYASTVAATWSLSVELANKLEPAGLAQPMFAITSMLDPHGIPGAVLTSEPVLEYLSEHRITAGPDHEDDSRPAVDASTAADALACLHRLSLITYSVGDPVASVRVHAVVQRAGRDQTPDDLRTVIARVAATAIEQAWPDVENDLALARSLRANTEYLYDKSGDALLAIPLEAAKRWMRILLWALRILRLVRIPVVRHEVHPVLLRYGNSIGHLGLPADAAEVFDHVIASAQPLLGSEQFALAPFYYFRAAWIGEAGDPHGAVAEYKALQRYLRRAVGRRHQITMNTRDSLLRWRMSAGDVPRTPSERGFLYFQHELLLTRQLLKLGPHHPDTLKTRSNAAASRAATGDLAGAIEDLEELLADLNRVYGPDHHDTLDIRSALALRRGQHGDPAAAAEFEALVDDQSRLLGSDHRATLNSRYCLAYWNMQAGDVDGARSAFQALLVDQIRVFGPDHRDTLATRADLATIQGEVGDPGAAADSFEELLADLIRIKGPHHPSTLSGRGDLAHWRGHAGDPVGAAAAFEALLADRVQLLGPDHPTVLGNLRDTAFWRTRAGDPVAAVAAVEAYRSEQVRVRGRKHPDTLRAYEDVAFWYEEAGDPVGAAGAYAALLQAQIHTLGRDHAETLRTRGLVAGYQGVNGEPTVGATLELLLADQARVLGPDDPATLQTRFRLAYFRAPGEDTGGTVETLRVLLIDQTRVLGPDHPDVLRTRLHLANRTGLTGDPGRAFAAFEALIEDRVRVYGADHPDTLLGRSHQAHWQAESGDLDGAVVALDGLLADQTRVLGAENGETVKTRGALTYWRERARDPDASPPRPG